VVQWIFIIECISHLSPLSGWQSSLSQLCNLSHTNERNCLPVWSYVEMRSFVELRFSTVWFLLINLLSFLAGQDTAKQALQEIVILPALRPEVSVCSVLFFGAISAVMLHTEGCQETKNLLRPKNIFTSHSMLLKCSPQVTWIFLFISDLTDTSSCLCKFPTECKYFLRLLTW
jgi:hypothetical protein